MESVVTLDAFEGFDATLSVAQGVGGENDGQPGSTVLLHYEPPPMGTVIIFR